MREIFIRIGFAFAWLVVGGLSLAFIEGPTAWLICVAIANVWAASMRGAK